jgi:hypothetical protein
MGHNYRWFSLRFNHRLMAAIHSGSNKPINSQPVRERALIFSQPLWDGLYGTVNVKIQGLCESYD